MQFKADDIAKLINGQIIGDPNKTISKFSKIEEADEDSICFYANETYAKYVKNTHAGILIVGNDFDLPLPNGTTLIKVDNPYESTAILLQQYEKTYADDGIEEHSVVHSGAKLGSNVYVGSFSYISEGAILGDNVKIMPQAYIGKNVKIGDNTVIHPGVRVYQDCEIGNNCIIHSGATIGGDGFGFATDENGNFKKIPQIGNVILEDNVEVGCNTSIDRATMGSTKIMSGSKLDNLVQIGHNVVIGKNTAIAALAGVAGSAKIGQNVKIGGLTGVKGHITIGDNVMVNACSGVWSNVSEGEMLTGNPAFDFKKMMRIYPIIRRLPDLLDRIRNIEKKLNE